MARIEGEIVIGHPVDVVSDYVADQSNEPQFNLRIVWPEKITAGPVGKETRMPSAGTAPASHRTWISKSREAPQCRSGGSQS
jgi:hypothetical protein